MNDRLASDSNVYDSDEIIQIIFALNLTRYNKNNIYNRLFNRSDHKVAKL